MKKLYILFTAAAFTAAACTSNLEIDTPDVTPEDNTPEVVDPDNDGITDGLVPLTFSIAAEGMTKTTIGGNKTDGYTVSWATGDKVRIVWNDGSKSAQTEGEDYYIADVINAETGEVAGYIPAGSADDDVFYAVYPETADYTLEDGTLTITIPREQSGTFKDANIMVAKTTKGEAHLAFKNMTSIISFSTSASMKSEYKYITFAANQLNTYALSGTVSTNFRGKTFTASAVAGSTSGRSYVSKTKSGALASGKTYYLAVLPETGKETISNGLGFKIQDSKFSLICGGMSKSDFVRSRGAVASLGAIDTKVRESWFIKQDGSDTGGKDWDNAGNAKRFVELLSPSYSDNGTTAGWRLTGATIYVADGEYNLQKNNSDEAPLNLNWGASGVKVKVVGSCTGSSTEQDLENCTTTFVCNQDKTTDHILQISGTVDFLSLDGITFTANSEATETNISGIALNCTSNNTVNVTFDKCKFTGITGSNTYGGSVIDITGSPSINFKGCTFKDNVTSGANDNYGGAIRVENGAATVNFNNCTADNNDVTSESGRAGFLCLRNGTVTINGGTIKNSNANGAAGAVFVNQSAAVLNINNCTVQKNSSSYGGFLYLGSGTVNIKGGTYEENSAVTNAGGAIYQNSGTLDIADYENTRTSFVKNTASSGGAIYSKSAVSISKASFSENDATANGGAIFNEGTLTLNGTTITGKGKDTNMTAQLGGGIYNKGGAKATINNNSVIEGCAITGNSHHGAAIWNGGALTIDGSILQNNINTQRGGGIYCVGTGASASVSNTLFDDNDANNGGAIALDDGATAYIMGCTFTSCNAINGAAIRTVNNGTNTSNSKALVFNSLFESNTSTGGRNDGGGITQSAGYGRILIANSTFKDNTTNQANGVISYNSGNCKTYVISDTFNGNTSDVTSGSSNIVVRNSLLMASAIIPENVNTSYCIWKTTLIDKDKNTSTLEGFALGKYVADKGVYILDDTYSSSYSQGMDVSELSKLSFNGITLTDDQKTLLAKDQKGNDRVHDTTNCKYMGAYVGEWWSNE